MSSTTITEAVILAGGNGTRLHPLTANRPKPLVPVANYSMLDWNLLLLSTQGIRRVIIVVKYLGHQIIEHVKNISSKIHPTLEIIIPDVDSADTADALRRVSPFIKSDNFIVTMGDIVTNIDIQSLATNHLKNNEIATIALKKCHESVSSFGVALLDKNMHIRQFLEKPSFTELTLRKKLTPNLDFNLINSGIYCFRRDILDLLNSNKNIMDFGRELFPLLLRNHVNILGHKDEEDFYWKDCGRPEQLLWSNLDVINHWNVPYFPKGMKLNTSWLGSGTNVDKTVILKSTALGHNVTIGKETVIGNSSINDNSSIGRNCTIKNSIIWENVIIGDNVVIRNSIISDEVFIGSNCIIDELSLIKSGTKIPSDAHIKNSVQRLKEKEVELCFS